MSETIPQSNDKPSKSGKPKPQPGKFPVSYQISSERTTGRVGSVTINHKIIQSYGDVVADKSYGFYEQMAHDPMEKVTWKEMIGRNLSLVIAKKLATSLTSEQLSKFGGDTQPIMMQSVSAPSAMVAFANQFGSFQADEINFEIRGQHMHAFNYFAKAVHDDVEMNNRADQYFVNTNWSYWRAELKKMACEEVNGWSHQQPDRNFGVGQPPINMKMSIPTFSSGFAAFRAFCQGINFPPKIVRALDIGIILENNALFGNGNGHVAALAAVNVVCLNWTNREMVAQMHNYHSEVDDTLQAYLSKIMNWVEVTPMLNHGSAAQLLDANGMMSESHCRIKPEELKLGWILAGEPDTAVIVDGFYVVNPKPVSEGLAEIVRSSFKI